MRKKIRSILGICVALSLLAGVAYAARTVYLNARIAKMRNGKTSASAEVDSVQYGQALEVVAEEGAFLQVKSPSGKVGWIAKQWTGDAPSKGNETAARLGQAARQGSGGEASYTAGARGLSDESKAFGESLDAGVAVKAVERMEEVKVEPAALDAFLQEGKLGEYQEVAK